MSQLPQLKHYHYKKGIENVFSQISGGMKLHPKAKLCVDNILMCLDEKLVAAVQKVVKGRKVTDEKMIPCMQAVFVGTIQQLAIAAGQKAVQQFRNGEILYDDSHIKTVYKASAAKREVDSCFVKGVNGIFALHPVKEVSRDTKMTMNEGLKALANGLATTAQSYVTKGNQVTTLEVQRAVREEITGRLGDFAQGEGLKAVFLQENEIYQPTTNKRNRNSLSGLQPPPPKTLRTNKK